MSKGDATKKLILQHAYEAATKIGLEGLTIGELASELKLSKSGLHGHFGTKEELQVQVIDHATERFMCSVIKPAFAAPRGEPRVGAVFQNWLAWCQTPGNGGGCFFVSATSEFDDRPGPIRERLVHSQKRWMDFVASAFKEGITEGHFHPDKDPDQFAYDMYGIILAFHHAVRLLGDVAAEQRARNAFRALLKAARISNS